MAAHEVECFADNCDLSRGAFEIFNVVAGDFSALEVDGFDGVVVGGSGDFSLVEGGFGWHGDYLELLRRILDVGVPMFASCFGFQGIAQALGGRLAANEAYSEIGTYQVELTDRGCRDPLFGELPEVFDAQLGHKDSVVELPDEAMHLARSERCEYQALRVADRPVIATQFHPELTRERSLDRFRNYLEDYKPKGLDVEEAMEHAREQHRPSPKACELLERFAERLRDGSSVEVRAVGTTEA